MCVFQVCAHDKLFVCFCLFVLDSGRDVCKWLHIVNATLPHCTENQKTAIVSIACCVLKHHNTYKTNQKTWQARWSFLMAPQAIV